MTGDTAPEELRQELRELDAQIAQLRANEQPTDEEGDVRDSEEIAADLTSVEEQQAIVGILEERREAVREKLRQLGAS
jgi:TolA-binding protein